MATGDILFLILFVVLPTAIIVSGIWAVLFVRMRPAAGVRVVEPDATAAEQDSATPALPAAIEETASVVAIAAGPTLSKAPEPVISDDGAALPTLSEREAIASINPVAADLLFDQPQPPAVSTPMRDHTPTEEMPAVSKAAAHTTTAEEPPGDETIAGAYEPAAADVNDVESEVEQRHTDELGPEPPEPVGMESLEAASAPATASTESDDVDSIVANEDDEADDFMDDDSQQAIDVAGASSDVLEGPQLSKRGPLRLIPADDADHRDRRRARGSGRQVPQLGRSVRRHERRVER